MDKVNEIKDEKLSYDELYNIATEQAKELEAAQSAYAKMYKVLQENNTKRAELLLLAINTNKFDEDDSKIILTEFKRALNLIPVEDSKQYVDGK